MNTALIVMGGSGSRFDKDLPKQFYLVNDIPLFVYTVKAFNNHINIDNIVIVSHKDYIGYVESICNKYSLDKVSHIVIGGSTREESVYNGLLVINDNDKVLIHDACRPLVDERIIKDNIDLLDESDAVVTAIRPNDTISYGVGDEVESCLDRTNFYLHQTPQSFKANIIKECYKNKKPSVHFTDDVSLARFLGYKIKVVKGSINNIKITTKEDLLFLNKLV